MKQLYNKRAVITGGSDGIGLGIAKAFVENGADIIIIGRNKNKMKHAKSLLLNIADQEIHCIQSDLSDCQNLPAVASQVCEIWSGIDILVNNAGVAIFSAFESVTPNELDNQINLNIKSPYLFSQCLLKALEKRNGNIINISSYFSHRMIPGRTSTAYSLTKGALDSFTKSLAFEVGSKGVRVNAIAPGTVDTQLVRTAIEQMSEDTADQFQKMISTIYPLGRIGKPKDIGGIAVYLASDLAQWVTGAIFNIDGGLTTN
jgi:NAD(P)-dependent dehydrogenase (short-subunit alcohol dehydrogenase family)